MADDRRDQKQQQQQQQQQQKEEDEQQHQHQLQCQQHQQQQNIHKVPLIPVKVPPHMRRMNLKVSSPSDNLSPFSQKLMAADLCKGAKPRSFQSMLNNTGGSQEVMQVATDEMEIDKQKDLETDKDTLSLLIAPSSPSRHSTIGGLVKSQQEPQQQ